MPINIQDYLLGRIPVGRKIDIPSYLMAKAAGGVQELTGTLPLYVRSRASQILENYIIYGTASGAGVETENLVDKDKLEAFERTNLSQNNLWIRYDGVAKVYRYPCEPNTTYTVSVFAESSIFRVSMITSDNIPDSSYGSAIAVNDIIKQTNTQPVTFATSSSAKYLLIQVVADIQDDLPDILAIVKGSTAPSSYIPHGYKLPITVTSNGTTTDYPIYIGDSKLSEEEYVDYESGKVYRCYGELTLKGNEDNLDYYGKFVGGNFFYIDLPNNYQAVTGSPYLWCNYYETTEQVQPALDKSCRYQQTPKGWNLGRIYICDNDYASLSEYRTHLTELYNANMPLKVRYLLKDAPISTDPPVPLPDITLPQGIATIDTEEEFKYATSIKGRINPIHYAYRINPDTAEITYLEDNENFTPAAMGSTTFDYGSWGNAFFMPRPCMLKFDGTVDYYLDPNDYSKKLDGTASDIADPTYDGNVMLEFPKIYYKFVPTGDDGEGGTFHCSNVKLDDDYECWCNYDANNNEIDHFYVHAYNAVILDSKMRSLSGYALTQENGADTTTGQAEIEAARANNQNGIDEWYTYLLADHQLLTYLATLMCKHVNHQTKFGRGIDSGSTAAKRAYVTGTLNDKGLFWGDTSSGTQAVKIFGIENFYGCVWKRAAGLIGTSTGYSYKLTHGTKDGSTATSFNTTGSGYKTIARTKPANGWVTTMHYESNGFWIPATTGTNRYNDYHFTGNGYAIVGGGSYGGSNCGSWYVNLYNEVSISHWNISSALSCKPGGKPITRDQRIERMANYAKAITAKEFGDENQLLTEGEINYE